MKQCPKCGFENYRESPDCPQCGIIYEKYNALHEEREDDHELIEEETDEVEQEPDMFEEEKESFSFDKDRIIEAVSDFFREYYLYVIIGASTFLVIITVIIIISGGIKGKTGIVSWTNVLGEQEEASLLFDSIELLRKPEIPDENSPDLEEAIICDMEKGSKVKVLNVVEGDFLKIEVLNGQCQGEIGYIPTDNFEQPK